MRFPEAFGVDGDEGELPRLEGKHSGFRLQHHFGRALEPVDPGQGEGAFRPLRMHEQLVRIGSQSREQEQRQEDARSRAECDPLAVQEHQKDVDADHDEEQPHEPMGPEPDVIRNLAVQRDDDQ